MHIDMTISVYCLLCGEKKKERRTVTAYSSALAHSVVVDALKGAEGLAGIRQ